MTYKKLRLLLASILFLLPLSGIAAVGDMRFDPDNSSINGTISEGLIEVTDGSTFGYVCDDTIDSEPALSRALEVAERYFNAVSCQESTNFEDTPDDNFILDNVDCNGSEGTWYDCPRNPDFSHNCSSDGEGFALVCTGVGLGDASPSPSPSPVPSMSGWGLGLLGLILAAIAGWHFRKSTPA